MKEIIQIRKILKRLRIFLLFLFIFSFLTTLLSYSQEISEYNNNDTLDLVWDRFSVSLGGFITALNGDIILGAKQAGLGVSVNLEDALGLTNSVLALRGDLGYRFGKRSRSTFRFGYFGLYRSASKVLESDIEIGDKIFPVGTEVSSKFNHQIFKANYDYAFFMDNRINLAFTVGLFIMPISFSISALGSSEESVYFVAPLPVLGLLTDFAITPKIFLRQNVEILYLEISSFRGSILDFNTRIEYHAWKHIGFGLGLNSYRLNISGTKERDYLMDFKGSLKSGYTGLLVYAKFYF